MSVKKVILGTIVSGILLFVWSGLTQLFPWGVPSVNSLSSQSAAQTELFQAPNVKQFSAHELTTPQFDSEIVGKVSTLATDDTFAWIIAKPLAYYSPTNYLIREAIAQFVVGLLLTSIVILTKPLSLTHRLSIVLGLGLIASVSTYGQLFNWWGLTVAYALGASFNLVAGWLLVGVVLIRLTIETEV
jgi:hypothetical protein